MKFSDGYWMMREGMRAHYPIELHDAAIDGPVLTLLAAAKPIQHRGDTLNTPLVTVECHAPLDDVVAVKIVHHAGEQHRGPTFEIAAAPATASPRIDLGTDSVSIASGVLELVVDRAKPFALRFSVAGKTLTTSAPKALAVLETADGKHYL